MEKIDLRSIYALLAFMNFFIPLVTWGVSRNESSRAINYWCIGGLLGAVGTIMSALNNPTYHTYVIISTEIFLLFSILYRIEGICSFLDKPQKMFIWVPITLFLSVLSANPFFDFQQTATFIHAVYYSRLIFFLYLLGIKPYGKSIWFTCIGYILVVIVLLAISIQMNLGIIPSNYLEPNFLTISLAFIGAFVIFSGYVGVVGVVLEKNRIREIRLAEEALRNESDRLMTEQISSLQRKRIVDQMSSTLAHELSQPLAIGLSGSQAVLRKMKQMSTPIDVELMKHMEIVINSMRRMSFLLDRIRKFLKTQPLKIEFKPINIVRLTNEVVDMMNWHASRKGVAINFLAPKYSIQVLGDRVQLSQLLTNLLFNAIDASINAINAPKEIAVSVELINASVIIKVIDNGNGFSASEISRAGEPFFTTKADGLGLGLSISQSIAKQHNATLAWANKSEGGAIISLKMTHLKS